MSDPYLSLPLDGAHAIEASAGTGKTFTLATLVLRLVVEQRLDVGEVLAVTFTEAATQELRARIRRRLLVAGRVAAGDPEADDSPEAAITRAVIEAHLESSGESPRAMARRLREAADRIDLAAIFTIHGFCARVLREHALECGQGFDVPELLANDKALREDVAADLWRSHATDAESVEALSALWSGGPQALAADLPLLVREPVLLPPEPGELPDPMPMLHAAGEAFADAARRHGDEFRAALAEAVANKVLHANSYKLAWIEELFDSLRTWCDSEDRGPFSHAKLPQLHRDTLLARTSRAGAGRTPDSPLCDAVEAYAQALARVAEIREAQKARLLHQVRAEARRRLAWRKQALRIQTYDDLVDRVADAVDGPYADALAARLRAQYRVALVDEFQDTDPRQWRIFDRVFGRAGAEAGAGEPALFLIGDPKQAIYGFRGGDVETYLMACSSAAAAPPLSFNFRSRPSVLAAIDALYARADASPDTDGGAFVDPRIRFRPVRPGGSRDDADYQRGGGPAPALTLWRAPHPGRDDKGKEKSWSAPESRELATRACVAAIHGVLADAAAGRARIDGRPVQPGDIAVLVRTHDQATMIRQALARVGIPAVAAGKLSLFATAEAREVHALLMALLHGADAARLRTALSTVLVGEDAAAIDALADEDALERWQLEAFGWRDRLQRGGPLALLGDLCAGHAKRLVGLLDGERRLTNYLQLGELLQEAHRQVPGLQGLADWLARQIAAASNDDEAQLLRLESDARRVQVVTLHKSKGLEYPLVFLPYAGIGGKAPAPGQRVVVNAAVGEAANGAGSTRRQLHWKLGVPGSGWDEAAAAWKRAQQAEDARLLYVGLTRARDALWVAGGRFHAHESSPLWPMTHDAAALQDAAPGAIVVDDTPPPSTLPWLPASTGRAVPEARGPGRGLHSDWWVHSFTQLSNADAGQDRSSAATQPVQGGGDEPEATPADARQEDEAFDARFSGSRFGVVLHDVLEHADFARWRGWHPGAPVPGGEREKIAAALGRGCYGSADLEDGAELLARLAGHTLTVALPEGTCLAALPQEQRRPEIEFQFALAPTPVGDLIGLLHAHGLLPDRHGFGARRRLEGLMTGLIDLTYHHEGRWYVLDYKSNQLPAYDAQALAGAMAHHEYGLQALIYTVALHRWLRFRLGADYDYARDFGGVRYLFCRGLDATRVDSPGVQAWRFEPELVHAVDALFAGAATVEGAP